MRRIWSVIGFLCAVCSCTVLTADEEIQFNRDIRPILADNCFSCHGPDAGNRKADFRLDVRDDAVSMKAFVPGNPETSTAISRILSSDDATRMPPPESHRELTRAQTLLLERWVRDGAIYQKHWAYETPVRPDVPADRHAVDYLIEQRLKQRAITAAPEADRRTLIRRVFLDLTGMPPTSEQVRAFQNDQSPQTWNTVIEQCLSSPHFGERMAVDWLDVVRFADTIGYHSDVPRNVWPYRDWVIRSFNENKPFDRFTREQIAGDLLPDADQESRIGSAFNRLVQSTEEGGAQPKDYESRMLADRVRAIGTVWLGQTTGCAQCHDHKFDPFTIRDFYSLGAFFADIDERPVGARGPGMPVADTQQQAILTRLQTRVQETQTASDATVRSAAETELKDFLATLPHCLVTSRTTQPRTVRMLPRGNWMDESGEVMRAAVPHYLPQPAIEEREPDRRDLADWLVSPNNPLTARTVMNRLWKQFFGTALSRNPADLGTQGEMPTNPELLDWLATEFVQGGWNVKQMIRIIVTSEAYRRSSITTPEHLQADPENREFARQNRFRLDGEFIRDQALMVSGLLSPKIGGPSVKPYQPVGYWENLNFPARDYVPDTGPDQHRRGLYTWWQRTFLHPAMVAFDAPNRDECTAERARSNIPQQALVLLNDPSFVECYRALAQRIVSELPDDDSRRIELLWQTVLQRSPDDEEFRTTQSLLEAQRTEFLNTSSISNDAKLKEKSDIAESADLAAWTHAARVLLNLHETVVRN